MGQSYVQFRIIWRCGVCTLYLTFKTQWIERISSITTQRAQGFWDKHMGTRVGVSGRKRKLKITKFSHIQNFLLQ